ncbi:hypothetical protein Tsubulata_013950 [Turnera subulata]|uniref:Uncharacterized protein n=1 Tax=Turnera subulata TaxID=218843 RepID=A0A9Q0JQI2_9ROSI|nr:hypothetical protein Tsubulata_013950 [Turnera subulata]
MGCKLHSLNPPVLYQFTPTKPNFRNGSGTIVFSSNKTNQRVPISASALPRAEVSTISFKTLEACKLGISRYPDFEYNALGGKGTGTGTKVEKSDQSGEISISFDLNTLYIPPLTSGTTKFLGLPLPPFLKIDIAPELFKGRIDQDSGKVDLEFIAKFWFSAGSIYRAPPLLVKTVLTSEESKGMIRRGRGERLNKEGKCRLVGVATVDPIKDVFMNTFLGLPTECLAVLNAEISFSGSS